MVGKLTVVVSNESLLCEIKFTNKSKKYLFLHQVATALPIVHLVGETRNKVLLSSQILQQALIASTNS